MSGGVELSKIKYTGDDSSPPPQYVAHTGFANPALSNGSEKDVHLATNNQSKPADTAITVEDVKPTFDKNTPKSKKYNNNDVDDYGYDDYDDDEEEEDEIPPPDGFALKIHTARKSVEEELAKQKKYLKWIIIAALVILYFVYFGFAMAHEYGSEASIRLLWMTVVVVACVILSLIWKYFGEGIVEMLSPCLTPLDKHGRIILWVILALIYIGVITFVLVDVFTITEQPYNLVSLAGLVCYVLLCFIFSYSPAHVNWRAVLWGIALQFIMALIILRWSWGFEAFKWIGDRVSIFLSYADFGAEFVFGEVFREHFFAFAVLPVVVFFSTFISMLYYLGVMQVVVQKVGWVLQKLLGTTAGESLNAAGNIFIGQSEAPLMIRPLINDMTRSELHAIMTGGFATIAGSVLAAYISFGVPANHLISASVMSAPAALAMAKLFYPETQKSKTTAEDVKAMEPSSDHNIIQAASNGASLSISLVANIAANLIAFLALLKFVNAQLAWFGLRLGWDDPELSFELICSYLFYPFALVMGTELQDCLMVAELVGVKTFLNEFVAYERLGVLVENKVLLTGHVRANGTFETQGEDIIAYDFTLPKDGSFHQNYTLPRGILQDRSEVISTYALCGFANFGSMGIMLGALGAMAPRRKRDLSRVVLRAMIAGNVACFMTACVAGIFYSREVSEEEEYIFSVLNGEM